MFASSAISYYSKTYLFGQPYICLFASNVISTIPKPAGVFARYAVSLHPV